MCLLGMFILGFCGVPTLRVLHGVINFNRSRVWSTLVNIVRVNSVTMSRRSRNRSNTIDDNGSDNLPCVSDKGTDAGSFPGSRESLSRTSIALN